MRPSPLTRLATPVSCQRTPVLPPVARQQQAIVRPRFMRSLGMFIARFIPWWLFAALAVFLGQQTFGMMSSNRLENADVDGALAQPAPDPVGPVHLLGRGDRAAAG